MQRGRTRELPEIIITSFTDAEDYRKQYAAATARRYRASHPRKRKPEPTEVEKAAKLEKRRQYTREYDRKLRENAETRKELNRKRVERAKADPHYLDKRRVIVQKYRRKRRLVVLAHYGADGTPVCRHCGFDDPRALVIDHINDDGAVHRKTAKGLIYFWLIKQNFPEGFQTLCANCNTIKEYERTHEKLIARALCGLTRG